MAGLNKSCVPKMVTGIVNMTKNKTIFIFGSGNHLARGSAGGKMKKLMILMLFVFLSGVGSFADVQSSVNYGHISLIEGKVKIISSSGEIREGMVNMPIVAGDQITTRGNQRLELQFDNGTILRLGKNSQLKVETVLANTLMAKTKVTTLFLKEGRLYSIFTDYNHNIFEVLTPNASVLMKNGSTNVVCYAEESGTKIFVDLGKVEVKYGARVNKLKTSKVKVKNYAIVTPEHKFQEQNFDLNVDFMAWNSYVNSNFKELHVGKNKLPPKAFLGNKALVRFTEKWSTCGEWVYDEFLGYVWKPLRKYGMYDRPFFNAKWVTINGQVFVVPTQDWGWIPSQLGAWVWVGKKGWVWMPGEAFQLCDVEYSSGVHFLTSATDFATNPYSRYLRNTLDGQLGYLFGNMDLYYTYISRGKNAWAREFSKKFGKKGQLPRFKTLPMHIQNIVKKSKKFGLTKIKQYFAKNQSPDELKQDYKNVVMAQQLKTKRIKSVVNKINMKNLLAKNSNSVSSRIGRRGSFDVAKKYFRSFSPDVRLAQRMKIKLEYDYGKNAVYTPKFGIYSNKMTPIQKSFFKRKIYNGVGSNVKRSSYSKSAYESSTAKTATSSTTTKGQSISGKVKKKK